MRPACPQIFVEFLNKKNWPTVLDEVLPKRKRADGGNKQEPEHKLQITCTSKEPEQAADLQGPEQASEKLEQDPIVA